MAAREEQSRNGPWTSQHVLHPHEFLRLSPSSVPESPTCFAASFFHLSPCKARLTMYTFLLNPRPATQKQTGTTRETKAAFFLSSMKEPDIYSGMGYLGERSPGSLSFLDGRGRQHLDPRMPLPSLCPSLGARGGGGTGRNIPAEHSSLISAAKEEAGASGRCMNL